MAVNAELLEPAAREELGGEAVLGGIGGRPLQGVHHAPHARLPRVLQLLKFAQSLLRYFVTIDLAVVPLRIDPRVLETVRRRKRPSGRNVALAAVVRKKCQA